MTGAWGRAISLAACFLLLVGASGAAQDQSQQNQPQPSPPQPSQPVPEQPAQNQPGKAEDKNEGGHPGQGKSDKRKKVTIEDATRNFGEDTLNKVRDWERGWLTGPYVGRNRELVTVTAHQRREIYLEQTFTIPSDYFKRMFAAAYDQVRDSPAQWPEGWGGYGERFASREGQFITANSLAALGNAALKYEPRYDQCKCRGFGPRARHAILRSFYTYNQSEVERRPQWALYGGAFGGGVLSAAWKPRPQNVLMDGAWGVVGQAGFGALLNFFTEFAGEINQKIGARRK